MSNAVRFALQTVTTTLDETHHKAMRRTENQLDDNRMSVEPILVWVSFTHRSLNVEEIQHALAITPGTGDIDENDFLDEEDLTAACIGLAGLM